MGRAERAEAEANASRAERDQWHSRAKDAERQRRGAAAGSEEPRTTHAELTQARAALEAHARGMRFALDVRTSVKTVYDELYQHWRREGAAARVAGREPPHGQREYKALREARLGIEAELRMREARDRERAKRHRDRHAHETRERLRNELSIGGEPLRAGYRSAELAAARDCGVHYEWDVVARCRRYRDHAGRELFTATRTRVERVRHDEAAETAALKIAAARFGGAVSLTGSGELRERLARQATREGIHVVDADLMRIIEDERARIARREPVQGVHADPARIARITRLNPSHRELMAWWQRIGVHERWEWLHEADRQGRKAKHPGDGSLNAWHTMRDYADGGRAAPESISRAREREINALVKCLKMTRLVLAHRPETLASADRVVVLGKGREQATIPQPGAGDE